jgi:hypothetical protein
VLAVVVRDHTVDARLEGMSAGEAQGVTDVYDGLALLRLNKAKLLGARGADLETPLFSEEQGKRADVCVLLMSNVSVLGGIGRDVVHHRQGTGGGLVVAVQVLEARCACKAECTGKRRQDGLAHDVVAGNGVLEDFQVTAVLDVPGNMRRLALDLVTRDLDHLVAVPGVLKNAVAGADWLVSDSCEYVCREPNRA